MLGFLTSLLGGAIGSSNKQQAQQMPQIAVPQMADHTRGMNSMATQKAANAFIPTTTDPYGYVPSEAVTVPGMPSNVANGKAPNTGNPLLFGQPSANKKPQGAWVDAWRQTRNIEYQAQDEVAKTNPIYGTGMALGRGLFNLTHRQPQAQQLQRTDSAIQNLF